MDAVILVALIVCGGVTVVGTLWLLGVTFSESILWGLASLFLPAASFVFVITHWEQAKRPFAVHMVGLVGLMATLFIGLPAMRARAQENAGPTTSAAPAVGVEACPAGNPASDGFSRWCCTSAGWTMTSEGSDCTSSPRPSSSCDSTLVGTTTTEACSTLGPSKKRRVRP
jgi:hypothetical protein